MGNADQRSEDGAARPTGGCLDEPGSIAGMAVPKYGSSIARRKAPPQGTAGREAIEFATSQRDLSSRAARGMCSTSRSV